MTTIKMINYDTVEVNGVRYRREVETQRPPPRGPIRRHTSSRTAATLDGCGSIMQRGYSVNEYLMQGNEFYTKAGAEHEAKRRAAEHRVLCRLHELRGDWEPDWSNPLDRKSIPSYFHQEAELWPWKCGSHQTRPDEWYATETVWKQVMEEMPDDVKLALGVEG